MADAIVSFVVQEGTASEADRPLSPSGTVVQYATDGGIVYQTDNGGTVWYCDLPQFLNINFQEDPLAYDTNRDITNVLDLKNNIGAEYGATYYCDVDILGYDNGSTATVCAIELYAEVDGDLVSGNHYTFIVLKNQPFRCTMRIKFNANAGDTFRLFANVNDEDFDSIMVTGGTCEIRRAYYID